MTARRWLLPAALILVLASCGTSQDSEAASPSRTGTPSATSDASPTPGASVIDLGSVDDSLVGSWQAAGGAGWMLTLNPDGTFALHAVDGQLDAVGDWGVDGGDIALRDREWGPAGGPCGTTPSAPYTATWQLTDDVLVLVPTDNAGCGDRWTEGSPEGWERQP